MSFENLIQSLADAIKKNTEEMSKLTAVMANPVLTTPTAQPQAEPEKKPRQAKKEVSEPAPKEQPKPEPEAVTVAEVVETKPEVVPEKLTVTEAIRTITFSADQLKALAFKVRDHQLGGMDMAKEVIRECGYKQLSEVKTEDYQKLGEKLSAKLEFLDNLTVDEGL